MKRTEPHDNQDQNGLQTSTTHTLSRQRIIIVIILMFGLALFAIATVIVLSLIPLYLSKRTISSQPFISPLLNLTFVLPKISTLDTNDSSLRLRNGNISSDQIAVLGRILENKLKNNPKLNNIQVELNQAVIVSSSTNNNNKRQVNKTAHMLFKYILRSEEEESIVTIYRTDQINDSSDSLIISFRILCRRPCKHDIIPFLLQNTFDHIDINKTMYLRLFTEHLSTTTEVTTDSTTTVVSTTAATTTTTVSQTQIPNITPDFTRSAIVSNTKDNEIMQINDVIFFGIKDYSGNVQSIYAIQTANAIYTINQGRITQIQADNESLIFKYNTTNNQFTTLVITQNSSYEIPSLYDNPNITFPQPEFIWDSDIDLPNPYTGIVLKLEDIVTDRSITDATLKMNYYDEQLGNRSTIMQNIGGGSYYSLLPTNDTQINSYFNISHTHQTVVEQSTTLLELIRSYPIFNICSQAPDAAKNFCSHVIEDMSTQIPNSLYASLNYVTNLQTQSNLPGPLYDFEIIALIPGEQPITIILDDTNRIDTRASASDANTHYSIDPNSLSTFSFQVKGARGKCNEQTVAGSDTPDDRVIDIGKAHTAIKFRYETYFIKDQIDVYYKNALVFSSGCLGTEGERVTSVVLDDNESSLRVNVIPDCAGETGTAWYYAIECAFEELICSGGMCYCGASKRPSTQTRPATSNGCGSENSWFATQIREKGDTLQFTPYCNTHDLCYGTCRTNKATCDLAFRQSMHASCQTNWMNATDIQNCQTWADRFYAAVDWLGNGPFEDAQKADCTCV